MNLIPRIKLSITFNNALYQNPHFCRLYTDAAILLLLQNNKTHYAVCLFNYYPTCYSAQ